MRVVACLALLPLVLSTVTQWHGSITGTATTTADHSPGFPFESVVVVVFGALYLLYWLSIWPHQRGAPAATVSLIIMAILAAVDVVAFGPTDELWLYVAIAAGCVLRPRLAVPAVLLVAAATAFAILVVPAPGAGRTGTEPDGQTAETMVPAGSTPLSLPGLSVRLSVALSSAAAAALPVLIAGLGTTLVSFLSGANRQLRDARTLQVRLATQEERTRVARDLHDTLGHSLSLMAVKLQVAEHLAHAGDRHAAVEVGEVRQLTLQALGDVRDTVSGYRQPTIDAELTGARIALDASGITLQLSDHHGALTPEIEAACGWIVREATTNVIKHSQATNCHISLERGHGCIIVSVVDDGRTYQRNGSGNGLRGLTERVQALGGVLTTQAAAPDPGFQLSARIPVHPRIRHDTH